MSRPQKCGFCPNHPQGAIELVSRDTWVVARVPGRGNAGEALIGNLGRPEGALCGILSEVWLR
jgi:hypothetical protein